MSNLPEKATPITSPVPITEIGDMARDTARLRLLDELEDRGVGMEELARVTDDLLHATKVKVQWEGGKPARYDKDGNLISDGVEGGFHISPPVADNVTRFNTVKLLYDFHDVMPSKRVDIEDKRQTRAIANRLIERMTQVGLMGVEDKGRKIHGPAPGEMALMGEMVKRKKEQEKGEVERGPVSLCPDDMADD